MSDMTERELIKAWTPKNKRMDDLIAQADEAMVGSINLLRILGNDKAADEHQAELDRMRKEYEEHKKGGEDAAQGEREALGEPPTGTGTGTEMP